ncbi:hypothetical protein B296_00013919 [Ensete ventricosum]|uniref:Uncharacterized protein n=1 Tax=Ensete ventricosum TaxID=4639 RepID=A0A426ZLB4_ENSVE|nr:hypothetical protein B296_00013919 [Ensete ventricosum]
MKLLIQLLLGLLMLSVRFTSVRLVFVKTSRTLVNRPDGIRTPKAIESEASSTSKDTKQAPKRNNKVEVTVSTSSAAGSTFTVRTERPAEPENVIATFAQSAWFGQTEVIKIVSSSTRVVTFCSRVDLVAYSKFALASPDFLTLLYRALTETSRTLVNRTDSIRSPKAVASEASSPSKDAKQAPKRNNKVEVTISTLSAVGSTFTVRTERLAELENVITAFAQSAVDDLSVRNLAYTLELKEQGRISLFVIRANTTPSVIFMDIDRIIYMRSIQCTLNGVIIRLLKLLT